MQLPARDKAISKFDLNVPVTVLILSVLVLLAVWTRFPGLSERVLAEDEYFFIKSVRNILEHGVPQFETGGYYDRGILLQYLTAILIYTLGDGGIVYRAPHALFGIGAVVMAYFLARLYLNRAMSLALVLLLTVSSWEIEFSRFARMYSAFQFLTVCFFWCLYRFTFEGRSWKKYIAVILAITANFTHELGIFLSLFLFLPVPSWFNRAWLNRDFFKICFEHRYYLAASSAVLGIGYLLLRIDLRNIGVFDRLPPGFVSPLAGRAHWLSFGSDVFGKMGFLAAAALASVCIMGWYLRYSLRNRSSGDGEAHLRGGLIALAACCAMFHQFSMCLVLLAAAALGQPRLFRKKPYTYLVALIAAAGVFWAALLLFNQAWIENVGLGDTVRTYLRSFRLAFFAFPDLYTPVFRAWADFMPMLGFFLGTALVWQIIHIRKLPFALMMKSPAIPIVVFILVAGLFPPLYVRTRYTHFLYPLALCVGSLLAMQVGDALKRRFNLSERTSAASAVFLCLAAFAAGEDFHPFHLANVSSDVISFRMGRYERFQQHWYQRFDFLKPAELVNSSAPPGSKIIVSYRVNTVNAYLKSEHAVYWTWDSYEFANISRKRGTRELWSNSRLLSSVDQVAEYTRGANEVWLVVIDEKDDPLRLAPEKTWPGRVRNVQVFKPGRDKRIEVWKIDLERAGGTM